MAHRIINATVRDLGDYVIASPRFVNSNDDLYEYGKKAVPIVESEEKGVPGGYGGEDSWKLFDCTEEELEKID